MKLEFREALDDDITSVTQLSCKWEAENITYGLVAGEYNDYKDSNVWVCSYAGQIIGYLSGTVKFSEAMCVYPPNSHYFEVDELYVDLPWRCQKIGSKLYRYVEGVLRKKGIEYILLSSATKDFMRIIDFYTSHCFDMWTMVFFKKIT